MSSGAQEKHASAGQPGSNGLPPPPDSLPPADPPDGASTPQQPDSAPAKPRPVKLQLLAGDLADPAHSTDNFYQRKQIVCVNKNEEVARIVEAEEGFVAPTPRLGKNVSYAADGVTILANTAGRLFIRGGCIWVEQALKIRGDVDFSTGNIEFAEDILITGSILDLFKVVSAGTISVGHAVEAADVRAGRDLLVRGGIIGKEKGHCRVKRNVQARFMTNANVRADGDITIDGEATNCHIRCGGRLTIKRGALNAGHAVATGGIACHTLGSPGALRTLVEAGIDEALRASLKQRLGLIRQQRRRAARIHELIDPLQPLMQSGALSTSHMQRANALLYEAAQLQRVSLSEIATLRRDYESLRARTKSEIVVAHLVHPGVMVRFPGLEAAINFGIRGPVHIIPAQIDGRQAVVVKSDVGGSIVSLPTTAVGDEVLSQLERLFAQAA